MTKFKSGDKIICVDDYMLTGAVKTGNIYTVSNCDDNAVSLVGKSTFGYSVNRFESLKELRVKKIQSLYE